MIGRDWLLGLDPGIALLIWASVFIAVCGGLFAIFWALMGRLGWTR